LYLPLKGGSKLSYYPALRFISKQIVLDGIAQFNHKFVSEVREREERKGKEGKTTKGQGS